MIIAAAVAATAAVHSNIKCISDAAAAVHHLYKKISDL